MSAIITSFSAPGDYDELRSYDIDSGSNLALLLDIDCPSGYTTWSVAKDNAIGDTVFFYCANKSMLRIGHARVEAKSFGDAQMIDFAEKEYALYKKYAGMIVAIGTVAEKPYKDGGGKYKAVITDLKRLIKPVTFEVFKKFITLNAGGTITKLKEDQAKKLVELMDEDYLSDPFVSMVVVPDPTLSEGKRIEIYSTRYERNNKVREAYLSQSDNPYQCAVCRFDFEKTYGELGKSFIEVHHIKPLSSVGQECTIDPSKDLVSLCSNCHRMIHRNGIKTVEELKEIIHGKR